ncbi:MAG TPA: alpha-L-arabinofuranosidase [Puia sp.]|nr:alpha-L-arabinofuranosidase [Puia sp.]
MQKGLLLFCCLLIASPHPRDPEVAPTIGFFMDDWKPKTFVVPAFREGAVAGRASATLRIDPDSVITRIPPAEFGHNADTWMGTMVTQPVLMDHLKNLQSHIIRWPAGSGSDGYFWNSGPGSMPSDLPVEVLDTRGKRTAPHWFYGRPRGRFGASVDDYYDLLAATGNEGLITVNYGYARYGTGPNPVATAAHLAADWVRYDHGRTRYWEIGNENYGNWELGYRIDTATNRDGQPQLLTGRLYGEHFRIFADSMRNAAKEVGSTIYIGAVMHETPPKLFDPPLTRDWNSGMIPAAGDMPDFYAVHNYFTPWNANTGAADILHDAVQVPGDMMDYVLKCLRENGAATKPIAMDEWNMFASGSKQQVSNISGLFSIIVMGEALRNKYGLAARWDMLNGWAGGNDHGLFSSGDEPGVRRYSPRPSFYYLYYLQRMLGDRLVVSHLAGDTSLRAYASSFSSGEIGAALVNTSTHASTVEIEIPHFSRGRYYWYSLEGSDDNGEFSRKVAVNGDSTMAAAGGPADYAALRAFGASAKGGVRVMVPARGAVFLVVRRR